ncbi:MAG: hypothetical protein KJP09_08075 [Bacteroidia bacterium]|nr:hypothetical protein [Bacteroidia bacterium]MBT8310649.1 hypothetical protein [Bacteroidia bacterium]NND12080.1 hypothetical protein [Flavobacteriaceae bacterium]NNL61240.1 hypothetical protein [Flavobacteriaceae bacterium]
MVLTVILLVLFVGIVLLLLIPVELCIDTRTDQYYLKIGHLAKASVQSHETEIVCVKLNIIGYQRLLFPLQMQMKKKAKQNKKKSKRKRIDELQGNFKKGLKVMKSFKVREFLIDVDTGDCIYNSKLYPVAALLNYRYGGCHVNFQGRNQLVLRIENRPIYILRSFINL